VPRPLFELDYAPQWGYGHRFFLDVEHRYTKMHRLVLDHGVDLAGAHIVDLGLARGLLLERFRRYPDAELSGIEIAPDEIDHARTRGLEPVSHFINLFEGNQMVARLPFDDDFADVVLAGEILEHIVDTESFLREIHRVLRPGGVTVLSTPNILWWKHRLVLLGGGYPDALEYRTRFGPDFGHVRVFAPGPLRELLNETGFTEIRIVGNRLGPISTLAHAPATVARALDRLADRYPSGCDTLIASARRPR